MRTGSPLLFFLLVLASCTPREVSVPAKTQLTLRIHVSEDVKTQLGQLRISTYRRDTDWVLTDSALVAKERIQLWPLDIPILPASSRSISRPVEVIVDALSADGQRLAQGRVLSGYAPNSLRTLDLHVYGCAEAPACSPDDCHGEVCRTCQEDGQCGAVVYVPPDKLAPFTVGESPSTAVDGGLQTDPDPGPVTDMIPDPIGATCTSENAFRCLGSGSRQREVCQDGVWQIGPACAEDQVCQLEGMTMGSCTTPLDLCRGSAGAAVCAGNVMHVCAEDGTSQQQMPCTSPRHCESGVAAKTCATCVAGEFRCTGRLLERCDAAMTWQPVQECPENGEVCNARTGTCSSSFCKAGAYTCSADRTTLERCMADGMAFEPNPVTCKPGGCDEQGGQCDVCTPMAKDCEGNNARVCNVDGQGYTSTPCAAPRGVCAGAGNCVACTDDTHCTAPECSVGSCNIASGTCATAPAPRNTPCAGGLCDGNGKCGYCGDGIKQSSEQCDDGNTIATDSCNNCRSASCGDGTVQTGEECDDGNTVNTDSCAMCRNARCGDGFVQPGEQCDDGNTVATDACNACRSPSCGDGAVQAGEQCDDGNTVTTDACANCQNARCGDGIRQTGVEECDDGNSINTDSCAMCRNARCGDGFRQTGEDCDDGNSIETDTCTNACRSPRCGDGFRQGTEECDDGNSTNTDTCTTTCRNARCGDGYTQSGEMCDDGNTSNSDACVSCQPARCGDGYIRAGVEECELNTGGWSTLSCRPATCTRLYFNVCSVNTNCASGEHCGVTGGVCSSWCSSAADCAPVPGYSATCTQSGMCALRCGTGNTCPTGLRCASAYGLCVQNTSCCGPDFGCEGCFWPAGA